jgi:GT2 family glycosyltransferase
MLATPGHRMTESRDGDSPSDLLVSVVICTHNPRPAYLERVLGGLRRQTLPHDRWELLVVDNLSRDPLAPGWDLSWHPHARHLREKELGVALARQCGMRSAAADLLVFVDDDNVLDPDYLREALKIGREWPELGVWGGSIMPEFEVEPAPHLREYLACLALREINAPRWSNVSTCAEAEPWGAGLCVRAGVADAYCRQYPSSAVRLVDRTGRDLLSGGDTEITYVACSLGLGMGIFPNLRVTHLIRAERVAEAYLLRVMEGLTASAHLIAFKWRGIMPKSPLRGVDMVRTAVNFALRRGFERRRYTAQIRGILRARSIITASATPSGPASGPTRSRAD